MRTKLVSSDESDYTGHSSSAAQYHPHSQAGRWQHHAVGLIFTDFDMETSKAQGNTKCSRLEYSNEYLIRGSGRGSEMTLGMSEGPIQANKLSLKGSSEKKSKLSSNPGAKV